MKTLSYALQQICSGFSITRNDTLALKHKRKAEELAHDSPGESRMPIVAYHITVSY